MQTAHPMSASFFPAHLLASGWVAEEPGFWRRFFGLGETRYRSPYTNRSHKLPKALRKEMHARVHCQPHLGIGA